MYRRLGNEPSSRVDWLPWGLSVFGASCAVFVLVKGVLPERSANRELVQHVARLESDLSRVRADAREEVALARDRLTQQALSAQAEVNSAREQERLRAVKEAARRDFGRSLAQQIDAGDVSIDERSGELVLVVRERLLFSGTSSVVESKGRRFLRQLADSIHRLPADQVYRIGAKTEKQQRSIARYLEFAGRVPHAQLATAGVPAAGGPSAAPGSVEIVLLSRQR